MNREELITAIVEELGLSWPDVARIWDALMEDVLLQKLDLGRVVWPGFGYFEWYERKARRRVTKMKPFVVNSQAKVSLRFRPALRVREAAGGW